MKRRNSRPHSLRTTLLTAFLLSALICFAVGFYNFLSIRLLLEDMTGFIDASNYLSSVQAEIKALHSDVEDYLFTRSEDALAGYHSHYDRVQAISDDILSDLVYDERGIKMKNLGSYISRYLTNADDLVTAKQGEDYAWYIPNYTYVSNDYRVITENIQAMLISGLQESASQYNKTQDTIGRSTVISYSLFTAAVVLVIVFLVMLSREVTRPIEELSAYARRVADGRYDLKVEGEKSSVEVDELYSAFAVMVENTQHYLDGLREKAVLENELNQEKIKGLRMDNLLQQSRLQALQTQMDPHFIFNTFNIGAQLALLEGDQPTREYLEQAARVFRYNLEGLGSATLADELEHARAYMGLLRTRFGEKLRYREHIGPALDLLGYSLPRSTIQPLVENAFIHGISPREEGGEIVVEAWRSGAYAMVSVSNTGEPFSGEKLEALYASPDGGAPGHISGLGLKNVIERLQLQFQQERPLEITCENGVTRVTVKIPPIRATGGG